MDLVKTTNGQNYYRVAIILERINELERAAEVYAKAHSFNHRISSLYRQGVMYLLLNKKEEASAIFDQVIKVKFKLLN